jgi:6-phospho-beta-glucosidase
MIDRIAILGGSSVYTPEFILSLISHNVNVKEIVLQGRPGKKLEIVTRFCERLLHKSGYPSSIISTTEVAEAVKGAKYVIDHIRVGGMKARLRDEKLPPRHGMIGDESLGAGGFANAMRTLPVVFEQARIIEEVNPDAVLIMLTNPMGLLVEALSRHSTLNVVGVCDLPSTNIRRIAQLLNRPPCDLLVDYIGINHMGWIQDVKVEGRSFMGYVLEKLEKVGEDGFDLELIDLFRMIPTQTVGLFFHTDQVLKKQQSQARFRAEVLHEAEQQILKLYQQKNLYEIPDLTRERNAVWYDQVIVPLLEAMEDKQEHEIVLTVKNDGAVRDLPDSCSVEVPVKVSHTGVKPRKVGSTPRFLRGLIQSLKESDRLTIEAFKHKSYEYALQALTVNPLVPSVDTARKFLDRLVRDEHLELH